jgi:hypothetical protein
MANLTKAELRTRVLQHLGVLAVGQSASAEDAELVDESIDAAHDRLRKFGLVPFATSAIPTWAQTQLRNYVAGDVFRSFGLNHRAMEFDAGREIAERELARQISGYKHPRRVIAEYM